VDKSIFPSKGEVIEESGELGELRLSSVDSSSEDQVNLSGCGSRSSVNVICIEFMNSMNKNSTNRRMVALLPCLKFLCGCALVSVDTSIQGDAHI